MKKVFLLLIAFVALLTYSCDKDSDDNSSSYSEFELEILDLVNAHRGSLGLEALVMNQYIFEQAVNHSEAMASQGVLSHDGFSERAENIRNNVGNGAAGENVAYNYPTAASVVDGWLNSTGHRENIEGSYTLTGIAVRKDKSGGNYYTQIFLNYTE